MGSAEKGFVLNRCSGVHKAYSIYESHDQLVSVMRKWSCKTSLVTHEQVIWAHDYVELQKGYLSGLQLHQVELKCFDHIHSKEWLSWAFQESSSTWWEGLLYMNQISTLQDMYIAERSSASFFLIMRSNMTLSIIDIKSPNYIDISSMVICIANLSESTSKRIIYPFSSSWSAKTHPVWWDVTH